MLSFTPSAETQQQLADLNNVFARTYAQVNQYSAEEKQAIHRYARISQIGSSTRIENAVLTDLEVQWVDTLLTATGKPTDFNQHKLQIENKLSKDRERSIKEVAGCRNMLLLIYQQANEMLPLTASHLRGLHFELMQYYPPAKPYSGRYKVQPNTVIERNHDSNQERTVLQPADPGVITEMAMDDLLQWYNDNLNQPISTIAVATEFVTKFLAIHPFQDGNGRLGRGLFLMCLLQATELPIRELASYLAIDRHIEKRKTEYYWALAKTTDGKFKTDSSEYQLEFFLKFMIKVLFDTLEDIEFYRNKHVTIQHLSETSLKILHCFENEPEKRLTTGDLITSTNIARRTIVNNLNTLCDKKLIQRLGTGVGTRYQLTF